MPENLRQSLGQPWLELVREHVSSLRFGAVQIIVHNSQVVQVERTERIRFDRAVTESSTYRNEAPETAQNSKL